MAKSKHKHFLLIFLLCVVLLIGITIGVAPLILSTSWGKERVISYLDHKTALEWGMNNLKIRHLGPQVVEGIKVVDPQTQTVFTAPKITSNTSLWSLLFTDQKSVVVDKGQIQMEKTGVSFSDIDIDLNNTEVTAKGNTLQGGTAGSFSIAGSYKDQNLLLNANFVKLPVAGIDEVAGLYQKRLKGVILDTLGPFADLDLKAKVSPLTFDVGLNLTSDKAHAIFTTEPKGNSFIVKGEAQMSSMLFKGQFDAESKMGGISLASDKINVPEALFHYQEGFTLTQPAPFTSYNFSGVLEKLSFPNDIEKMELEASLNTSELILYKAILRDIFAKVQMHGLQAQIGVQSSLFSSQIEGNFHGNTFTSKKPTVLNLTVKQEDLSSFIQGPKLTSPADIKVVIEPFDLDLTHLENSKVKGKLQGQNIVFENEPSPLQIEEIEGTFNVDNETNTYSLLLSAFLKDQNHSKGSLNLNMVVKDKDIDAKLRAEHLALRYLNPFFPKQYFLEPYLGEAISLNAELKHSPEESTFSLKSSSPLLISDVALLLKDNHVTLLRKGEPLTFSWTLTPEAYALLETNSLFALKNKGKINIVAEEINCPMTGFTPILKELQIKGDLFMDKLQIHVKKSGEELALHDLKVKASRTTEDQPISLDASLSSTNGRLTFTALVQNFQEKTAKADIKIEQFPSSALDFFSRMFGSLSCPFTCLFGDTINGSAHVDLKNLNGPVDLNIYSPGSRASLKGELKNGVLLLKEPLHAQMMLTEGFSKTILKEVNPLSISSITSKNPLTLQIAPEGVAIPIYPYSPERLSIPKATIELGQIFCKNEGNINIALSLLKARQTSSSQLKLWFSPLNIGINNGVINLQRTEVLVADTYDIALWGNINLVNDRVDMILGLTADCLRKSFGIKKLPDNYVLQIPMKGKTDNVKINTKKATAKIALLMAWQKRDIAGAIGGGVPGAILGEFVGKVITLPDEHANTPAAPHPFPWEEESPPPPSKRIKKTSVKSKDKPLKQLLKVLLS